MKALENHIYAQVIDGKFHWQFTANELPEWHDKAFHCVDITNMNPMPKPGYLWNGESFMPPPPPSKPVATEAQPVSKGLKQI